MYKGGIYGVTNDHKIFSIHNGEKYAFARYSGERLTSFIYDETYAYGNALFGYIKGKGHYLIHAVSGIKSEIIFDEVNDNRNASPVKMLHGKKVLIDKNGKLISKFYDDISAVENSSLYRCELGDLQGLLDKKGNEVMPPCLRCSYNISSSEDGVIRSFANPETKDYDYFYYDENYQLINTGEQNGENIAKRNIDV